MTIAEAARLMEWSETRLQRLEVGNVPPDKIRTIDVRELCRLYDFDDTKTTALFGLARQANTESWYHEYGDLIPEDFNLYMGLEASARSLTSYQPDIVEGLLQTADYARVLARDNNPNDTQDELAGRVRMKIHRQSLITRRHLPATLDAVVHEAALRRVVGDPSIMAAQCRHLAEIGKLRTVTVRVLPNSAGVPLGDPLGPFVILRFGEDKYGEPLQPAVVYVESFLGDLYLEKKAAVERYYQAYRAVQHEALDDVASRNLLRSIAREYGNGR
jgi:hypothetical protein